MQAGFELLPWNRPLLEQAVEWLCRQAGPALDLSRHMVIVPTRQAGRRLRERLALAVAERDRGILAPLVVTPDFLVTYPLESARVADRLTCWTAWSRVVRSVDLGTLRAVFPQDPVERDFRWGLQTAQVLDRLKLTLGEIGMTIGDVSRIWGEGLEEPDRWEELGELEARYQRVLAGMGREDPSDGRLRVAQSPFLPEGIEQMTFLGVPDPLPLALTAAERLPKGIRKGVVAFGPAGGDGRFDAWGRPRLDAWQDAAVSMAALEERVRPSATPYDQAVAAGRLTGGYRFPEQKVAVGLLDKEVYPYCKKAFAPWPVFDPEGIPCDQHELFHLLQILESLLRTRDFTGCGDLIRAPAFSAFLARRFQGMRISALLEEWDAFRERHLPATLSQALAFEESLDASYMTLKKALTCIQEQLRRFETQTFSVALTDWLKTIFRGARWEGRSDEEKAFLRVAHSMMAWLEGMAKTSFADMDVGAADWLHLLLSVMRREMVYQDRPKGAIELQGWLELLWEDAPHLIVTGVNEGNVPESVVGDPFLPDSLRRRIGLKDNQGRLARDTYLMQALVASREKQGRIDWIFGRSDLTGEPLRPSRLFFQCEESELPRRIRHLFQEVTSYERQFPWQAAFPLRPQSGARFDKLSVTQFRDYLSCPFRFYLKHGLQMESVDPWKAEMDPLDFGELCHEVFQAFGEEANIRDSASARAIRAFLEEELEKRFWRRYGESTSAPLRIQKEALRQRLGAWAEVQAEERSHGWQIHAVEWPFSDQPKAPEINGIPIRGKIDRIDIHESTNEVRVLDYKTSEKGQMPREAHCRKVSSNDGERLIEAAYFRYEEKEYCWTNLQLPLYVWALEARFGRSVRCGYFNLPKAIGQTGVFLWDGFSSEWVDDALKCAEAITKAIREGHFWPPNEAYKGDDLDGLFFGEVSSSVDPTTMMGRGAL